MTEADLADTSISLRDVQAVLLSMFSADTVLIGHSLESDLLALKVLPSPGSACPGSSEGGCWELGGLSPGHLPTPAPWGPGSRGLCPASRPQVIHSTVVDTSVLFPHRLGLPYKRSLRNLMADYLRQIIQDNGEQGAVVSRGSGARGRGAPTPTHPPPALPHSGRAQLQ